MEIHVGSDAVEQAARRIAGSLRNAHRRRSEAFVALSGGSTAPPLIASLLDEDVPWETTTIWQVDERVAPDGDEARNANQLTVIPCFIRLMPVTGSDLRRSARQYGAKLPERFDVVHLGVGDDGHTASWPPGDTGPIRSVRSVELIDEFNGTRRMTLTRRVVNAARSRVVLATGASKRPVIERWLDGDDALPIAAVKSARTWVYLDGAAAPANLGGRPG